MTNYREILKQARADLEIARSISKMVEDMIEEGKEYSVSNPQYYKGLPSVIRSRKDVPRFFMRDEKKRELRNLLKGLDWDGTERDEGQDVTIAIRGWDAWDSSVEKKFLEGVHFTEEEREEYIDDMWEHWYNPWNDGRDCTGVWFTSRIATFDVPNGTWVYHFRACDV